MNLAALITTFILYGLCLTAYNGETSVEDEFPTFDAPGITFEEIPDSCSGFTDCIEYVGKVFVNFILGVIYVVLLLVEIITLIVGLLVLSTQNAFTGAEGAPAWINAIALTLFGVAFAIAIYRAVRKGDTETA